MSLTRRTILATPLAAVTAAALTEPARARRGATLWREGAPLNQWDTDRCTAWGTAAAVLGGMSRMTTAESQQVARRIWLRAEQLDVYPGRVERGATTMQGSAAALVELDLCTSVRWLTGPDQVLAAIHRGPVVWASPWLVGMWTPRNDQIQYGSERMRGNHGVALTGYDPKRGLRVRNSWGRSWAGDGSAWLSVADFRRLWKWQPGPDFPGPRLPTYCEAFQPVGLAFPPIRETA